MVKSVLVNKTVPVSSAFIVFKSVVIDDASAARVHKLLTIVNVASNFPLIIVGLGGILLIVLIVLLVRDRNEKVPSYF